MANAIFRGPTKGYVLTDKDVDWLARSLWGEASDYEGRVAVAWCHIMRFLLYNYKWLQLGWPFYKYVQAHSQPINPLWRRDGSKCSPGSKYWDNTNLRSQYCNSTQLARRDKCQKTPYARIPEQPRMIAEAFARGEIPNPFTEPVYDFAACKVTGGKGIKISGNCFLRYQDLKDKNAVVPGEVELPEFPLPKTTEGTVAAFLSIPVVILAGYALTKAINRLIR